MRTQIQGVLMLTGALCVGVAVKAEDPVGVGVHELPHSAVRAVWMSCQLPAEGIWMARQTQQAGLREVYLEPTSQARDQQLGARMGRIALEDRLQRGSSPLRNVFWLCQKYARAHDGRGPASWDDLPEDDRKSAMWHVTHSPWRGDSVWSGSEQIEGPFIALVPDVHFAFHESTGTGIREGEQEILAIELRPYLDDGQHWVVYTNGRSQREPINGELVERISAKIRPATDLNDTQVEPATQVQYRLVVAIGPDAPASLEIPIVNTATGQLQTLALDLDSARQDSAAWPALQAAREQNWRRYSQFSPAPVLRIWGRLPSPRTRNASGRTASTMDVLGGRAAVEETLQLQDLAVGASDKEQRLPVDVDSLQGVQVKSHPYDEMLAGGAGGSLPIANAVPTDRFMVYVAQPAAVLPLLDHGAPFLAESGMHLTGNRLDYGLVERYIAAFGLSRPWLETILTSGMIRELAVFCPDLFLIEGTHVTVVSRLADVDALERLTPLLGIDSLREGEIKQRELPTGGWVHWALQGDLMCISTSAAELRLTLDLITSGGEGSLGRSAEFRYMLTQLAPTADTRMFAYFSDPFIRRLVGPRVKLGQLRRMKAKARMEFVVARALQARLDGVDGWDSIATLAATGYLTDASGWSDIRLEKTGTVRSAIYGPLATMSPLDDLPLEEVTPEEAEAYERYVENYSRYWRQFFDPIAIRLNDTADGALELSTFILPLVDNSLYNGLRTSLMREEQNRQLQVPHLHPQPVLQLSANLQTDAMDRFAKSLFVSFQRFIGVSSAILDDLGPAVHFAVFDSDPVLALGSGDILGAFGSRGGMLGRGEEMLMIPAFLSLLTRPCAIMIESEDPDRTVRLLRQASGHWITEPGSREDDFRVDFYQENGRDAWVWQMEIVGWIKLRFGIEVKDGYLILRNLPWSSQIQIESVASVPECGASLLVNPAACQQLVPSLIASAADQQRTAALSSMGRLYPLVISGQATMGTAGEEHRRLFGYRPLHPGKGKWSWQDQHIVSSIFGTVFQQQQPGTADAATPGLLNEVSEMRLSMQLEDEGLRSTIRWTFAPANGN